MKKKTLYIISASFMILSLLGIILAGVLIEYNIKYWWTMLVSTIIFVALFILTCFVYFTNAEFVCEKCNKQFKPTVNASFWAIHAITRRYLRCPHCKQFSWAKETWKNEK